MQENLASKSKYVLKLQLNNNNRSLRGGSEKQQYTEEKIHF